MMIQYEHLSGPELKPMVLKILEDQEQYALPEENFIKYRRKTTPKFLRKTHKFLSLPDVMAYCTQFLLC